LRTPVALFIFNRPRHTARVLEAIGAAKPPRLFVIGDGPRAEHPEDERLVSETRAAIDRVDWPCEVRTCYSDVNLNCHKRIASGLDWVFANVPEAIVLEDDCLPDQTFFPYCEQLLERYRDDERVHMISGSNPIGACGEYSYHFSRCYAVWGWASWARAWKHYDAEMRAWPRLRKTRWLEDHLGDRGAATLARFWFDQLQQWDFQWMFSGWLTNAVTATPSVNLVTNIGFGQGATHLSDANHPFADVTTQPIDFPLTHPPRVEPLESADRATWEVLVASFMRARRGPRRRRIAAYLGGGTRRLKRVLGRAWAGVARVGR
jgi:hypothetical protein